MVAGDFPIVRIYQFDTAEIADPSGQRHIPGGSFAFQRAVSLGCSVFNDAQFNSTSGVLTFENTKFNAAVPTSHIESKVTAIIFALGVSGTAISNMRLYIIDNSALMAGPLDSATESAKLQYTTSGIWQPNAVLPSGITNELSTTVPELPNIFRQDGANALKFVNDDNVSQYVYMNLLIPLGFPFGNFGVCGSGLLRLGLIFDYFSVL